MAVAFAGVVSGIFVSGIEENFLATIGVVAFTLVGAIILDRKPGEPVGRICLGIGVLYGVAASLRYVVLVMDAQPGRLPPGGAALAVIGSLLGNIALMLGGPLLISRFPMRAAVAWQRRLEDILLSVVLFAMIVGSLRPGALDGSLVDGVPNPLALDWIPVDADAAFALTIVAYATTYLVTTAGLVRRYRRGGSIVRAQVRWFAASVAVSLGLLVLIVVSSDNQDLNDLAWSGWIVSLLLPPIAIGIAILRYRLFDIDRIISNAIGYGLVTVVLSAVFVSVNLALITIFSRLVAVEGNGIAVAGATLVAAALFNPVRVRVQRAVDQRFHRARYDAERTVSGLAARLRDEVDVDRLREDIVDVVVRSVEPTGAELWLRPGATQ